MCLSVCLGKSVCVLFYENGIRYCDCIVLVFLYIILVSVTVTVPVPSSTLVGVGLVDALQQ